MSFFLPAYFQKRILRYAFSQIDLIDTDNVNFDDLDLTWGKRSRVELRNVRLRHEKLNDLCRLPELLHFEEAIARVLRIHVPADLYREGIELECHGVRASISECATRSGSEIDLGEKASEGLAGRTSTAERAPRDKQDKSDGSGTFVEYRDGRDSTKNGPVVSDVNSLAASFIQSESTVLQPGQIGREDRSGPIPTNSSGESGYGTGLPTPGFFSSFLHGIIERLRIRFIGLRFDLTISNLDHGSVSDDTGTKHCSGKIEFSLEIASLVIEAEKATDTGNSKSLTPGQRSSCRHISVVDLRGIVSSREVVPATDSKASAVKPQDDHWDSNQDDSDHQDLDSDSMGSSLDGDLTASRLFTTEEASSLYFSAHLPTASWSNSSTEHIGTRSTGTDDHDLNQDELQRDRQVVSPKASKVFTISVIAIDIIRSLHDEQSYSAAAEKEPNGEIRQIQRCPQEICIAVNEIDIATSPFACKVLETLNSGLHKLILSISPALSSENEASAAWNRPLTIQCHLGSVNWTFSPDQIHLPTAETDHLESSTKVHTSQQDFEIIISIKDIQLNLAIDHDLAGSLTLGRITCVDRGGHILIHFTDQDQENDTVSSSKDIVPTLSSNLSMNLEKDGFATLVRIRTQHLQLSATTSTLAALCNDDNSLVAFNRLLQSLSSCCSNRCSHSKISTVGPYSSKQESHAQNIDDNYQSSRAIYLSCQFAALSATCRNVNCVFDLELECIQLERDEKQMTLSCPRLYVDFTNQNRKALFNFVFRQISVVMLPEIPANGDRMANKFMDGLRLNTWLSSIRPRLLQEISDVSNFSQRIELTITAFETVVVSISDITAEDLNFFATLSRLLSSSTNLEKDDTHGTFISIHLKSASVDFKDSPQTSLCLDGQHLDLSFTPYTKFWTFGFKDLQVAANTQTLLKTAIIPTAEMLPREIYAGFICWTSSDTNAFAYVKFNRLHFMLDVLALSDLRSILSCFQSLRDIFLPQESSLIGGETTTNCDYNRESRREDSQPSWLKVVRPWSDIHFAMQSIRVDTSAATPFGKMILLADDFAMDVTQKSPTSYDSSLRIGQSSLLLLDDARDSKQVRFSTQSFASQQLRQAGFAMLAYLKSVRAYIVAVDLHCHGSERIDIEFLQSAIHFETCADSTKTLLQTISNAMALFGNGSVPEHRTEVAPIEDLLASLAEFGKASSESLKNSSSAITPDFVTSGFADEHFHTFEPSQLLGYEEQQSIAEFSAPTKREDREDFVQEERKNFTPQFVEGHFEKDHRTSCIAKPDINIEADVSNSTGISTRSSISVKGLDILWKLYDGFDWARTRRQLTNAIDIVQSQEHTNTKAVRDQEILPRHKHDLLFNSIYVTARSDQQISFSPEEIDVQLHGIPANIETERSSFSRQQDSSIKFRRGLLPKATIEIKGISINCVVSTSEHAGPRSDLDLKVRDLNVLDQVPSSSWRSFAACMLTPSQRPSGSSILRLLISSVRPDITLNATELMIEIFILPLRLHVDQDTLDFFCRFFDFRDDLDIDQSNNLSTFVQRIEIHSVNVKLDFKPKRIDYAGLRSGRTVEFMNFFVLEEAEMILKRVILYGVPGIDRVAQMLNDIWMPDVRNTQLPQILLGVGPTRTFANVGAGVQNLIVVPLQEYRNNGGIVRGFRSAAGALLRTTTGELVRLGAKIAIGTYTLLNDAEQQLVRPAATSRSAQAQEWQELDEEEIPTFSSPYANQPVGVVQGAQMAYENLHRDLFDAKDAIVALPGEILDSKSPHDAAQAVLKSAPTIVLRPASGITRAIGQTLLGATNSLEPSHRQTAENKYK